MHPLRISDKSLVSRSHTSTAGLHRCGPCGIVSPRHAAAAPFSSCLGLFHTGKQLAAFAEACSTLGLRNNRLTAALTQEAVSERDASDPGVATDGPALWGLDRGYKAAAPIRGLNQRVSVHSPSLYHDLPFSPSRMLASGSPSAAPPSPHDSHYASRSEPGS